MTIKLNLSTLTPEDAQTMKIRELESVAKEFGFTILWREKRGTMVHVFIPTLEWKWALKATGNKITIDLRELVSEIILIWNATPEPEPEPEQTTENIDPVLPFYDDQITPSFGETGSGTIEALALMESEDAQTPDAEIVPVATEPTEPTEPTEDAESANLLPTLTAAFSPQTIGAISCVVKVVNVTGKYEIMESSSEAHVPVGKTYNSTIIVHKDLGSIWAITCHLTDKGSIKIDSITEPVAASSVITPVVPVAPSVSSVAPIVTTEQTPEPVAPVARTLSANIDEWECPDYYISPDAKMVFGVAYKLLQKNASQSVKILMTGESGYGKTTIAEKFAQFVGFDCYRMNCAAIRDTEEWFFDREVKTVITNGVPSPETVFTPSEFAQTIARGNCVVILDEFNRLESNLHNSLFPLLDDSGKTTLHHIDFTVGPNVIFVGTVNLGAKFVGTFLLDDALTNRFDFILEVRPMPFDHECAILKARYQTSDTDADSIVRMATILRENEFSCSTRDTLKIAKMASVGLGIRDAFEYVVVRRIPEDESNAPMRKALVDLVNKTLGTRGVEFMLQS